MPANVSADCVEDRPEGGFLSPGLITCAFIALVQCPTTKARKVFDLMQVIAYNVSRVIYCLFFHPLRNIPGPLLARSSLVSLLKIVVHATLR